MHTKPRLTYLISNIDRWAQFEWIADELVRRKYQVQFILLNAKPGYFEDFLVQRNYPVHSLHYRGKRDLFVNIFKAKKIIEAWSTDLVHCHFVDATLVGLSAAKLASVPRRIYTRHHANYHHLYAPKGVLLDRYSNTLATKIIAITQVVKDLLVQKEGVPDDKVKIVHHGFKLSEFVDEDSKKIQIMREKYNIKSDHQVVGVASRFIHWKGVQYIISAFIEILKTNPRAILFLANARGPYKPQLLDLLKAVPADCVRFVEFEKDMFTLFHCFDVFVHCPVDTDVEAFGQVYVEACAAKRACVFARSGIANDFFTHEADCLIVPHQSPDAIAGAVTRLLNDAPLRERLGAKAQELSLKNFTLEKMVDQFEEVYLA